MSDVIAILKQRFGSAIVAVGGETCGGVDPLITASKNPQFGDFQANVAMSLAKQLKQKPRDLAQQLVDQLEVSDICDQVTLAGPGFINLRLKNSWLSAYLQKQMQDDMLGVAKVVEPMTTVVDYSAPNVAKEMHVGHLRSSVIGDAIARVLAYQGHPIIRQNHLGDWGTQFGMLIEELLLCQAQDNQLESDQAFAGLENFYKQSKKHFDNDPEFANLSRARVVKLQAGDPQTLQLWKQIVTASAKRFDQVYQLLGVLLTNEDIRGESSYNDMLGDVIADLDQLGLLQESQNAKVVFPQGFKDREGEPLPMIVQKSDGGYLYATTDLAAARYRIDTLGAKRIVYVTDSRQSQHFAMLFHVLGKAKWANSDQVQLDHVPFGTVLGKDRKPFKTRTGGTIKLIDLLNEAHQRALAVIADKNPDWPEPQKQAAANVVGIGALKYADLSSDRVKDYVFDWDRMLALEGNTAPYLQNAYVRIGSIFRKGEIDTHALAQCQQPIAVDQPAQRALALTLLHWPAVVQAVSDSLEPHRLCTYLYELASQFHHFYEICPVLGAKDESTKTSRLMLCHLVRRTLKCGLSLLGIGVAEQM